MNTYIWELDQELKPDFGWNYVLGHFIRAPLTILDPGDQSNPVDSYEIMSYASEARSRALGRVSRPVVGFASTVNMSGVVVGGRQGGLWGSDPLAQGDFSDRKWHSGQFNFTNMQVKGFWSALMKAFFDK